MNEKKINAKLPNGNEISLTFTKEEFETIITFHEKMLVWMTQFEENTKKDSNKQWHETAIGYITHIRNSMFEEGKK